MSEPTYTISADGKAITCARCHVTSYHPMDIFHKYCAACRVFHEVSIAHDARSADALLHEVARLRQALAWYADVGNYDEVFAPGSLSANGTWSLDGGNRARAALKARES